jgi:hypothetical protein
MAASSLLTAVPLCCSPALHAARQAPGRHPWWRCSLWEAGPSCCGWPCGCCGARRTNEPNRCVGETPLSAVLLSWQQGPWTGCWSGSGACNCALSCAHGIVLQAKTERPQSSKRCFRANVISGPRCALGLQDGRCQARGVGPHPRRSNLLVQTRVRLSHSELPQERQQALAGCSPPMRAGGGALVGLAEASGAAGRGWRCAEPPGKPAVRRGVQILAGWRPARCAGISQGGSAGVAWSSSHQGVHDHSRSCGCRRAVCVRRRAVSGLPQHLRPDSKLKRACPHQAGHNVWVHAWHHTHRACIALPVTLSHNSTLV